MNAQSVYHLRIPRRAASGQPSKTLAVENIVSKTLPGVRHHLADRLMSALAAVETPDWVWFEEGLSYDNARLSQALMLAGMATQKPAYVEAGLRSLHWLMIRQTAPAGHFRPVGTAGFGDQRKHPRAFDQQPVEATATIAACLTAWRADGDAEWKALAARVFRLVCRQQRSLRGAGRSAYRQLP
jgi:hypothetical protein